MLRRAAAAAPAGARPSPTQLLQRGPPAPRPRALARVLGRARGGADRHRVRILRTLLRAPGKVFTRDELMTARTAEDFVVSDRTIDSHVRRMRGRSSPRPAAKSSRRCTALAIGSRSPEPARPTRACGWSSPARGAGWTFVLVAARACAFVRVYDNQLIRQTETELHRPGRGRGCGVTASALRAAGRRRGLRPSRWPPRWPFGAGAGGEQPLPSAPRWISRRSGAARAAETPRRSPAPAPTPSQRRPASGSTPLLVERAARHRWPAMRVVDTQGVVVASQRRRMRGPRWRTARRCSGPCAASPARVLRRRAATIPSDAPLASLEPGHRRARARWPCPSLDGRPGLGRGGAVAHAR